MLNHSVLVLCVSFGLAVGSVGCGGGTTEEEYCKSWNLQIVELDCVKSMTPADQDKTKLDCTGLDDYANNNNCSFADSFEECLNRLKNGCENGYPPSCTPLCVGR